MLGRIAQPPTANSNALTTLDEPVSVTILRDVRRVGIKLRYVLLPNASQEETLRELKNWDLWGPLVLCLWLSLMLSISAPDGQSSLVFAAVFVIVWCGAAVVTLNAQLLGGNMYDVQQQPAVLAVALTLFTSWVWTRSFFQSVCVLGYCIFPLNVAAIFCMLWRNAIYRFVLVAAAFLWATRASVVFMSELVPDRRRALGVYPVFLFYIVIGWMVAMQ